MRAWAWLRSEMRGASLVICPVAFRTRTGDAVLVEASPVDRIWGIGLAADDPRARDPSIWLGLNLLGFALMKVRAQLG